MESTEGDNPTGQHQLLGLPSSICSQLGQGTAPCARGCHSKAVSAEAWERVKSHGERINHSSGCPVGCGEWGSPAPLCACSPAWAVMLLWCVPAPPQAEGQRACGSFPSPGQTHSNFSAFQATSKDETEPKIPQERGTLAGEQRECGGCSVFAAPNPPLPQPGHDFNPFFQMPGSLPASPLPGSWQCSASVTSFISLWHPSSPPAAFTGGQRCSQIHSRALLSGKFPLCLFPGDFRFVPLQSCPHSSVPVCQGMLTFLKGWY